MKKYLVLFGIILLSSCGLVDFSRSDSISTNPSEYNQVLAEGEDIYVKFGFEPEHSSAQAAFEVQDSTGRVGGTFSWNKSVMTFHPQQNFSVSHRYMLKYAGQVLDTSGIERTYNIYIPFYFKSRAEASPTVTISPDAGSVIKGQDKVVFSFSRAMDSDLLIRSFSISPAIALRKIWNSACTQLTVIPEKAWKEYTVYNFTFSKEMCTSMGTPLSGKASWALYSASGAKIPFVSSVDTSHEGIEIKFSESMDRDKTGAAFSISPSIKGHTHWNSDSRLMFVPEGNWEYGVEYIVSVSASAQSAAGLFMQDDYETRFIPDVSNPKLLSIGGKDSDSFPITDYDYTQEIEIDVGTGLDPENIYTFSFTFDQNLLTAEEKEKVFSSISLRTLFPYGVSNPKTVYQFWIGDDLLHITYTGFVPGGCIYSLAIQGEKITVRTK